jgi:adenine-specific DNA-methyltransferase
MFEVLTPIHSLNKAYLRARATRTAFDLFCRNLKLLLDRINEEESEEFHKNLLSDFLKTTYYAPAHFINTKDKKDLVIHEDKDAKSPVAVIIETKAPGVKGAMPTSGNMNVKALQELLLYYLRERKRYGNYSIKHLIITNVYEWYVFDAHDFERVFIRDNKHLVDQYSRFEANRLSGNTTDFFYSEIAAPAINAVSKINGPTLPVTYFNLKNLNVASAKGNEKNEKDLVALFKVLSPAHLLKLPVANDSNKLDDSFYKELLYLIGLVEVTEDGKTIIKRRGTEDRVKGSLLENTIDQLIALDKLARIPNVSKFGLTNEQRLFSVALELVITWINRILFLKLLEGQLIRFHRRDAAYAFVSHKHVTTYNELNTLFFSVLARKLEDRDDKEKRYAKVPYLNSTLFEPTELEQNTVVIGNLETQSAMPVMRSSILKDEAGKTRKGTLPPLTYLLDFLSSYDFSSEGAGEIQEENKTLINASVLGLLFEKLNGYKDGSFFTPGAVTMLMCRQAVRTAVRYKFNEVKGWTCKNFEELYNSIEDKKEANEIINSIKIVDPAVGSGHFLVSALNELITIKSDLHVLMDQRGKTLRDFDIDVANDELVITSDDGAIFEYNPRNAESQRVQEALFHEKKTLIENCLFGVDINPNSVKICRLRLWIELLKNTHYRNGDDAGSLETLPNIDVNVKRGDSLISRYALESELADALKSTKSIEAYRGAVASYWNADDKTKKRELENLIENLKSKFRIQILANDPKIRKMNSKKEELRTLLGQHVLFEESKDKKGQRLTRQKKLTADIEKLEEDINTIKSNKVYENGFEWRIEFPELLDDAGNFVGFDVVIGNPPYIDSEAMVNNGLELERRYIADNYKNAQGNWDIYVAFFERGFDLLNKNGQLLFITPDKWISKDFGAQIRTAKIANIASIIRLGRDVFEHALVDSIITRLTRREHSKIRAYEYANGRVNKINTVSKVNLSTPYALDIIFSQNFDLIEKINAAGEPLGEIAQCESACATSDAYELKPLLMEVSEKSKAKEYFRVVNTGTLDKYAVKWGAKSMTYLGGKYDRPIVNRTKFRETFNDTYYRRSTSKKIIIKGLTRLDAALDLHGNIVPGKSTLVITLEDQDTLKFICGVLNSKLAITYMKEKYSSSTYNGGIVFSKQMFNSFPMPTADKKTRRAIVQLVDKILVDHAANKNDQVARSQKTLDELVYRMYNLNENDAERINELATGK